MTAIRRNCASSFTSQPRRSQRLSTSWRRSSASAVEQPGVAVLLHPQLPSPQASRAHPQNLSRLQPAVLPSKRPQNHVPNSHRSLQDFGGKQDRHLRDAYFALPAQVPFGADTSLALGSGQIICSLQRRITSLTVRPERRSLPVTREKVWRAKAKVVVL